MLVAGCGSKEMPPATPPTPDVQSPVAQVESQPDAALAIAFANNWLLKPDLAKAGEVKAMLEEAKAVKPKEVGAVLEQINLQVSVMEQAKRFDDAVVCLKSGDAERAAKLLVTYVESPQAKKEETKKAREYSAMLEKIKSEDAAKAWLMDFSIEELERVIGDKATIVELTGDAEPIQDFWEGVGQAWLANVQMKARVILKESRPLLRQEQLARRVKEWEEQKTFAIKLTQNSLGLKTAYVEFEPKSRHLALVRKAQSDFIAFRAESGRPVDDDKLAMIGDAEANNLGYPNFGVLKQAETDFLNYIHSEQFHLQVIAPDESHPRQDGFTLPDGFKVEVRPGMGIDRITPLAQSYRPNGDYFNSFETEEQTKILLSGALNKLHDAPKNAKRLCFHNPVNKAWSIVDRYYTSSEGRVISAFSGLTADSPEELYRITYDHEQREKQYVEPPQQLVVGIVPGAPWTVFHFILPDCPGWLVAENQLGISAEFTKGKLQYAKVSRSSKDQVLVDLYVSNIGTGELVLKWKDKSDEGDWEGEAVCNTMVLSYVDFAAKDVAKVIRFGNLKGGKQSRFRASADDTEMILELNFPKPIRSIDWLVAYHPDLSYDERKRFSPLFDLTKTGKVEIAFDTTIRHELSKEIVNQHTVLNKKAVGKMDNEEWMAMMESIDFSGVEMMEPGDATAVIDYANDPRFDVIALDFGPVFQNPQVKFFDKCYLRLTIPKGELFALENFGLRVSQPE